MKLSLAVFCASSVVATVPTPPTNPKKIEYKLSIRVDKGSGAGCTEDSAKGYVKDLINEWDEAVSASSFTLDPSPNDADVVFPSTVGQLGSVGGDFAPRRVHFLDTEDAALHKGGYIFRWRWDLDSSPDPYGNTSDFTFKRRDSQFPTWAALDLADSVGNAQVKWKKQHTNRDVDPPLYGIYAQYKDGYQTVSELQAAMGGVDFTLGTVADWEKAFPAITEFASTPSTAKVNSQGLSIYQYEVRVGSGDKLRFTLRKDGKKVTKKLAPSIVMWCEQDEGSAAFTGEFTWVMNYDDDASGIVDFFSEMVGDGLGGYLGGAPKTCMAYEEMGLVPCDNDVKHTEVV